MAVFTRVSGLDSKHGLATPKAPFVNLGGGPDSKPRDVAAMWDLVTGRSRVAIAWCEHLQARLTRPSPWCTNGQRDVLYQSRDAQTLHDREREKDDRSSESETDHHRFAVEQKVGVEWQRADRIVTIGDGGSGKSWWVEHLIVKGHGDAHPSIASTIKRLRSGESVDRVPLPVMLGRNDLLAWDSDQQAMSLAHAIRAAVDRFRAYDTLDGEAQRELLPPDAADIAKKLLIEQFIDAGDVSIRGTLILDAAEHFRTAAKALLSEKIALGGRLVASTRPSDWYESRFHQGTRDTTAHVTLAPLRRDRVRALVQAVRLQAGQGQVEEVTDVFQSVPGSLNPLIITLAAGLHPNQLSHALRLDSEEDVPRTSRLMTSALTNLLIRTNGELLKPEHGNEGDLADLRHYINDESTVALLGRLGAALIRSIGAQRTITKDPAHAFELTTHLLEQITPEEEDQLKEWSDLFGRHGVTAGELLRVAGVLRPASPDEPGRMEFGNDVVRDFAVACAIAFDKDGAPTFDGFKDFLAPGYSDQAPGALRDYLNLDPTVVANTSVWAGELLNDRIAEAEWRVANDGVHGKASAARRLGMLTDRVSQISGRLARPTPFSELPHSKRPGTGWPEPET